jgi:hypothetical protein
MEIAFLPLMILNLVGGIVAAVWLAILGDWVVFGIGIAIAILGSWIIKITLVPARILFGAPGIALANRGKNGGALLFGLLNAIYTSALICAWCLSVFYLMTTITRSDSIIPLTLFAYGCSTAPWAYLSQKDQQAGGNEYSNLLVLFAEIAFVIAGFIKVITNIEFRKLLIIFSCIMAVAVVLQMIMAVHQIRRHSIQKIAT